MTVRRHKFDKDSPSVAAEEEEKAAAIAERDPEQVSSPPAVERIEKKSKAIPFFDLKAKARTWP